MPSTVRDTAPQLALYPPEVETLEAFIVVFLLFFAVLAFAWFYLQRAKARTTTATAVDEHPTHSVTDLADLNRPTEPTNRPTDPAP